MKTLIKMTALIGILAFPIGGLSSDKFQSVFDKDSSVAYLAQEHDLATVDDIFDTRDVVQYLAQTTMVRSVRVFRKPGEVPPDYWKYTGKAWLAPTLKNETTLRNLSPQDFRPLFSQLINTASYGDVHECGFEPAIVLLIGDQPEPDLALLFCFSCHEVYVVRRPTPQRTHPYKIILGMSPELNAAALDLARKAYPDDKALKAIK